MSLKQQSTAEEQEWIRQILAGEHRRFELLVHRYQSRMFRVAIGFMHRKEDAEDAIQDAFIKAFQGLQSFKGESEFATWLYRITVRTCLAQIKHKKKIIFIQKVQEKIHLFAEVKSPYASPEQNYIDREYEKQFQSMIDQLPEKQKIAFVLHRFEELSQKEIATVMQTSEGAVEQYLYRAKQSLKKKLNPSNDLRHD